MPLCIPAPALRCTVRPCPPYCLISWGPQGMGGGNLAMPQPPAHNPCDARAHARVPSHTHSRALFM